MCASAGIFSQNYAIILFVPLGSQYFFIDCALRVAMIQYLVIMSPSYDLYNMSMLVACKWRDPKFKCCAVNLIHENTMYYTVQGWI